MPILTYASIAEGGSEVVQGELVLNAGASGPPQNVGCHAKPDASAPEMFTNHVPPLQFGVVVTIGLLKPLRNRNVVGVWSVTLTSSKRPLLYWAKKPMRPAVVLVRSFPLYTTVLSTFSTVLMPTRVTVTVKKVSRVGHGSPAAGWYSEPMKVRAPPTHLATVALPE